MKKEREEQMSLFFEWHRKAWPRLWEPGAQARMGARLVIRDLPILHYPSEMTLTERNQEIQTTPPQAANQAFAIGILPRRAGRDPHFFYPHSLDPSPEEVSVNAISVS